MHSLAFFRDLKRIFASNVRMSGIWRYTNTPVLFGARYELDAVILACENMPTPKTLCTCGDGFNHPAHGRGR